MALYELKVTAATDHQVVATLTRDPDAGAAEMYLRHETVPTNHWGHYDLPIDYVSGTDLTQELVITEGDGVFEAGTWYAGVYASAGRAAAFDVDFAYYECPRNCSDRGTCVVAQNGTRHCECDLGPGGNPYLKEDCSEEFSQWSEAQSDAGSAFAVNGTLASSEYDYFALPSMDARESRRQIEVVLSASFTKAHAVYDWEEKPALLLKRGGRADFPSVSDYTFKTTLERAGEVLEIELCASQFAGAAWNAAVYNPGAGEPMAFAVSFTKRAVCPSATAEECSGHGTCRSGNLADPNFATCARATTAGPRATATSPPAPRARTWRSRRARTEAPARRASAVARAASGGAAGVTRWCVLPPRGRRRAARRVPRRSPDAVRAGRVRERPFPRRRGRRARRAWCGARRTRTTRTARSGCGRRATRRRSARALGRLTTIVHKTSRRTALLAAAAAFAAVALCVVVAAAARGVCDARETARASGRSWRGVGAARAGFSEETRGNGGGTCTRTWTRSNARTLTEGKARASFQNTFDVMTEK